MANASAARSFILSWRPQVRSKELILLRMVNLLAEQAIGVIQAQAL